MGTVFNGGPGFVVSANGQSAPGQFLFATADGTISAWAPAADMTNAIVAVDNSGAGASYLGLALATDNAGNSFIYAADIAHGRIDVFDDQYHSVALAGEFVDPDLPVDFAPFNIQRIGDELFVTYIPVGSEQYPVDTLGNGVVDVFHFDGTFVERFAAGGPLDYPWGIALAPASYGPFGGALLVGNNGDGRISAFDRQTGAFLGQLADENGDPIANPNLWGLSFGNGHMGGDANTLFFAAGYEDDAHGLFGAIQDPLHRGADTAGPLGFDPTFPGERSDYPLPPMNGPMLSPSVPRQVEATLLPLSASPLALAPTLTTSFAPNASALPSAALSPSFAIVPVSFDPTNSSRIVVSTTLIPSGGDSLRSAATEIRDNPASLSAFLDISNVVNVIESGVGTTTAPSAMSATPEPRPAVASVVPAAEPQNLPMPAASERRLSQASLPASDAATASLARPSPDETLTSTKDPEEPHHERDGWLKPARTLLLIVGLTLLGTCSLTWRRNQRPTAAIIARELEATRVDPIS